MTTKESLLKAVEDLPDECLDELATCAELLRCRTAAHSSLAALASE